MAVLERDEAEIAKLSKDLAAASEKDLAEPKAGGEVANDGRTVGEERGMMGMGEMVTEGLRFDILSGLILVSD